MSDLMVRSARWCAWLVLLALPGCGPRMLSVDDAVAMNGNRVPLVAYVSREHIFGLRTEIEDAPVAFLIGGQKVGENTAGEQGCAVVTVDSVPETARTFQTRSLSHGQTIEATGRIFHWDKSRVILAVDIDHTISQTDYRRLIFKERVNVSPPIPGARETLNDLAKDYYILYLTARPRFLIEKTREWLDNYGFPAGPVVAAPRVRDAMHQLEYKQKTLHHLREQWPDLLIGIGNRTADIEAYASNDMLPVIVYNSGEEKHYADAVVLQDWQFVHRFFEANRQILTSPPQLHKAIGGELMFLQPIVPYKAQKSHYKPKPFEPGD